MNKQEILEQISELVEELLDEVSSSQENLVRAFRTELMDLKNKLK